MGVAAGGEAGADTAVMALLASAVFSGTGSGLVAGTGSITETDQTIEIFNPESKDKTPDICLIVLYMN